MNAGQVSLDYLILSAIFISCLALIVPQLFNLYDATVFALDVSNAEAFAEKIIYSVEELQFFAEPTKFEIESQILTAWEIKLTQTSLLITVNGEKNVSREFPEGVSISSGLEGEFKEKIKIDLIKQGKLIEFRPQ